MPLNVTMAPAAASVQVGWPPTTSRTTAEFAPRVQLSVLVSWLAHPSTTSFRRPTV